MANDKSKNRKKTKMKKKGRVNWATSTNHNNDIPLGIEDKIVSVRRYQIQRKSRVDIYYVVINKFTWISCKIRADNAAFCYK